MIQFGSYAVPPTITLASNTCGRTVPSTKLPRADGAREPAGYLGGRKIQFRGGIWRPVGATSGNIANLNGVGTSPAGTWVQSQLDALKSALNSGPANLQLRADRYYRNSQLSTFAESFDPTGQDRMANVSFDLTTGDPYAYEVATQSVSVAVSSSGQNITMPSGGNAPYAPVISLTAGATGNAAWTIGGLFTITGAVTSGDVIAIDGLGFTVMRGGVDVTSLFDGLYPGFLPAGGVFPITWTGSVNVSNYAATWSYRWF